MILKQCFLTNNDCYKRGAELSPKGVMVHSTGANNPWLRRYVQPDDGTIGKNSNGNDWNRSGLDVCVHAFIGKTAGGSVAVYQTLPWEMRGWHAGSGRSGRSANDTHISFEICEDALTDRDYFNKAFQAAAELTAWLCRMFDLDPLAAGVVIDHSEGYQRGIASNHGDVTHWLTRYGKDMDNFRRDVKYYMETGVKMESEENEMRYNTLKDLKADKYNAQFYLPTVEKLMEKGVLRGKGGEGDETILDLGEDAVRLLVILDRQGVFGE